MLYYTNNIFETALYLKSITLILSNYYYPMTQLNLENFLPYHLVVTADLISHALAKVYAQHNITISEWRILAHLATHESLTPGELGRLTNMEKARVSRALILMDSKALITRTGDSFDKRIAHIKLTETGKNLYALIEPEVIAWNQQFHQVLGKEGYPRLLAGLKQLEQWGQEQRHQSALYD
jgi:DNA-binding MarR family transcriptional regulator